ncbi:unnamed protein product [Cladocopium goreaui]|uniref:Copia protein n=1 Tax=Cladocopium goreaui TaxID=2562237 RepID=A0A9P1C4E2_9DINO|nr:unnamed protein product [Cladocopium goreaui]
MLLQEGDSDALLVHDFESALSETVQEDPELARKGFGSRNSFKGKGPVSTDQEGTVVTDASLETMDSLPLEFLQLPRSDEAAIDEATLSEPSHPVMHSKVEVPCHTPSDGSSEVSVNPVCFATHTTFGVLDLGASKTVIGSDHVKSLICSLDQTSIHMQRLVIARRKHNIRPIVSKPNTKTRKAMSLSQRLKGLQMKSEPNPSDVAHLSIQDLENEMVDFGKKNCGRSYMEVWNTDQEQQMPVVVQTGLGSTEGSGRVVNPPRAKANVKFQPKAKAGVAPNSGYQEPTHFPLLDEELQEEIEMYNSLTMVPSPLSQSPEFSAMQERLLNLENALTKVVNHLETQVRQLGHQAFRFGLADGDLSKIEGHVPVSISKAIQMGRGSMEKFPKSALSSPEPLQDKEEKPCRGTDRTLAPPTGTMPSMAPYRKSLMIIRSTAAVKFETHWEKWPELSNRQLIRPAHSCRLNVTMFAKDQEPTSTEESQRSDSVSPSITVDSPPQSESTTKDDEARPAEPTISLAPDLTPSHPSEQVSQSTSVLKLPKWERQKLMQIHKNLGHPTNERLAKALRNAGQRPEMVQEPDQLQPKGFRHLLQLRESVRKAFHIADNREEINIPNEPDSPYSPSIASDRRESDPSLSSPMGQPDQEPEIESRQVSQALEEPNATNDPESHDFQLLCVEEADALGTIESQDLAWRCEFDVTLPENTNVENLSSTEACILLATNAKKQRTEVRLHELNKQEREQFEQAKAAEVANWIQTKTLTKADRVMAVEPVPEIRKAMQMAPNEVGQLNKGAYGLIDAPYLWYKALVGELTRLAETTSLASALDQMAWIRLHWRWLHDPKVQWRDPDNALLQLVPWFDPTSVCRHLAQAALLQAFWNKAKGMPLGDFSYWMNDIENQINTYY